VHPMNTHKSPEANPTGNKKRIFIVDDHVLLRDGLTELINRSNDLVICGEASSSEEAQEKIPAAAPDLTVVDLTLPGAGGLELIKILKARLPGMPLLVLSMHDEALYAERAIRAGARGYVMKLEATSEVENAIRHVLSGEIYLSPQLSTQLLEVAIKKDGGKAGSLVDRLSDREFEVFKLIGKWQRTSEIARRLQLSIKTIETYQAKLKEKLNLKDSNQLLQHALKWIQENDV